MPSEKRARQRAGKAARMAELRRAQQRRRRLRVGAVAGVLVIAAVVLAVVTSLSSGNHSSRVSVGKKGASASSKSASSTKGASPTTAASSATPPTAPPDPGGKITGATPCPPAGGATKRITTFSQAPPMCIQAGKPYTATITTNMGTVVVALDTTKTPETANNFVVLSRYHYYDNTAMFRTDPSIGIIQGGAPATQSASDPGPGYTIKDEGSHYTYTPGDLVMARTSAPNSAGAQYFFCVTSACSNLDSQGTYVVFGHVSSGLPVLQKILGMNVNTDSGLGGAPKQLVLVKSVTISGP